MINSKIIKISEIEELAHQCGLTVVGICTETRLSAEKTNLKIWQEAGHAGEMQYMERSPELFSNLENFLPQAKCIVSFAFNYSAEETAKECPDGFARVARYAWGQDYHIVIKNLLELFVSRLRSLHTFNHRIFTDAVPLLERAFAVRSQLGFIGKNSMLIKPRLGSFLFLGEVILDCEVETPKVMLKKHSCGECTNCMSNCPTSAIVSPYIVDARKCISYLTIEKRGFLNIKEQNDIGNWLFGCDICQEVCPFNYSTMKKLVPGLSEFQALEYIKNGLMSLDFVLSIDSEQKFKSIFAKSAITRTKRLGLLRNAICVIANQKAVAFVPRLLALYDVEKHPTLKLQILSALLQIKEVCENNLSSRIKATFLSAQNSSTDLIAKFAIEVCNEHF